MRGTNTRGVAGGVNQADLFAFVPCLALVCEDARRRVIAPGANRGKECNRFGVQENRYSFVSPLLPLADSNRRVALAASKSLTCTSHNWP